MFNEKCTSIILQIAADAGKLILEYYQDYKKLDVKQKKDDSPVTKADLEANDFIIKNLQKNFPQIAIISEENPDEENFKAALNDEYFLIDPIDGTSSFIKKSGEFTVNIALIKNKKPIFGVIYLPTKDEIYFTNYDEKSYKITNYSQNAEKNLLKVSNKKNNLTIICTKRQPERSIIEAELKAKNIEISQIMSISSSYKFCLIAAGKADYYPRRIKICAWDIAAGHAIVNGAGGKLIEHHTQKELKYDLREKFEIAEFDVFGLSDLD